MTRKESGAKPPSRSQLKREFQSGKLLGMLFGKHSRKWGREDAIVDAICLAHHAGDIDVLAILSEDALGAIDPSMFHSGQALYASIIPKLDVQAADVVRAMTTMIAVNAEAGTSGLLINALAKWAEKNAARPRELLDLIDNGAVESPDFLMPVLVTGMIADTEYFIGRAHGFARSAEQATAIAAVRALGLREPANTAEWAQLIATLTFAAQGDDALKAAAIEAVVAQLKDGVGDHRDAIEDIVMRILVENSGGLCLYQCANALWLHNRALSQPLRDRMLEALVELEPSQKTTIDHLDYALADMFKDGGEERVVDFLEHMVHRHGRAMKLKRFHAVCRAAHEAAPATLHNGIVGWFLKGDLDLCEQMARALFGSGVDGIVLDIDFSKYGLRAGDFPYIGRKAVGFLFLKPVTAASIVVSLLRSAPPAARSELEDVLFDPLLLNYAGVERKLLGKIAKTGSDKARQAVKRALTRIEAYRADLQAASPIKELHPSERQRQTEWQRNADEMAKAHKKADKKSILADLFSKVIVLHGQRTISYHRIGKEEPKRFESKMGTFSTSFEMPRIEVADPVGLQRMLLSFRGESRPE